MQPKMRIFPITACVLLFMSLGYSFRITDFMEAFAKSDYYTNEGQDSDVADQILPVFSIAFFAS